MFLLAAIVTIGVFLTLVPPDERARAFYVWMAAVCTGEFLFFAWSANGAITRHVPRRLSGAVQMTVYALIVVWLVATIVAALIVAPPGKVQNYYADTIAAIYAALTFLFFFAAYLLYMKDLAVQQEDRVVQADRLDLRKRVGDIENVAQALRACAQGCSDYAVPIDRLLKRLDGVRTSLDYAPPGKIGTLEEEGGRHVDVVNAKIEKEIDALLTHVAGIGPQNAEEGIEQMTAILNQIDSLLNERKHELI